MLEQSINRFLDKKVRAKEREELISPSFIMTSEDLMRDRTESYLKAIGQPIQPVSYLGELKVYQEPTAKIETYEEQDVSWLDKFRKKSTEVIPDPVQIALGIPEERRYFETTASYEYYKAEKRLRSLGVSEEKSGEVMRGPETNVYDRIDSSDLSEEVKEEFHRIGGEEVAEEMMIMGIGVTGNIGGPGKKGLITSLFKSKTTKQAAEVLESFQFPKSIIDDYSKTFANTSKLKPKAAKKVITKELDNISEIIKKSDKLRTEIMVKQQEAFRRDIKIGQNKLIEQGRKKDAIILKKAGEKVLKDKSLAAKEIKLLEEAQLLPKTAPTAKKLIGEKLSPIVKRREMTLLKDKLKNLSSGARTGSIAKKKDILKAGDDLKASLKKLGVDKSDMHWFTSTFKNLKGVDDLIKKIPEITARAERLSNLREVRRLTSAINKEIKTALPKTAKSNILKGKFGAEVSKTIDFLKGKKNLKGETLQTKPVKGKGLHLYGSKQQALKAQQKAVNKYLKSEDGIYPTIPDKVIEQIDTLNMVGIQDMSARELESVLKNLRSIKQTGKTIELLKASNRTARLQLIKDTAVEEMTNFKAKPVGVGKAGVELNPISKVHAKMMNAIYSTKQLVEKMTKGKSFKVADWAGEKVHMARNSHSATEKFWRNTKVQFFHNAFGDKKLGKVYRKMSKQEVIWKGKNAFGEDDVIKWSQFEAAEYYNLIKKPKNIAAFKNNNGFTPEMFKAVDDFIDPKMKQYADNLQQKWMRETIRPQVAERYAQKTKTALADDPNFWPVSYTNYTPEDDVANLLLGQSLPGHSLPSSLKKVVGSKNPIKVESIEVVSRRHAEKMNQFIHYDALVSDLRAVFNDRAVKSAVLKSRGGKELHSTLIKKIDDIERGTMAATTSVATLDSAIGRFTQATLTLNFVPLAKQLTSLPGFVMGRKGIKYSELMFGSMLFAKNPSKWTKMFAQDDWLNARLTSGFSRETALAFKAGNKNYTIKELNMTVGEFMQKGLITPTRGGDVITILPGLVSKYTQVTKKLKRTTNLTKKQIHDKAMYEATELAAESQQSPWIENLGRIQTANSFGKAATMYQTTPIQYLRISTSAARMWSRGQMSPRKAIRTIFTSWVLLPQLFQYASNGFNWNSERQMRALLIGPINYYPAVGNLFTTFFDAFQNGYNWKDTASAVSPLLSMLEKGVDISVELGEIYEGDGDIPELTEEMYELIALNTGLPSTAPRTIEGIMDLVKGDTKDPRRLFWSEWALEDVEENIIRGGPPIIKPSTSGPPVMKPPSRTNPYK